MDFELKAAKAKWEREQAEKKERARARLERERRAREAAARQHEAIEEARRRARIEAAEAALAAQRQDEEDRELGDGVRYSRVLRAFKIPGDGDKITLPAADFEVLASQNAIDKGPMFFEISNNASSSQIAATHGGVLEFTAEEGFVGLPWHVWSNAGLLEGDEQSSVRVRYVRLPKGRYAKLQPESPDFGDVPNHKAVLETKLRHHAALSCGDVLSVSFGGVDHRLLVLELQPASAVSVLETDMEVDVDAPLKESFPGKIVPLLIGKAESGVVEEGQYRYYKFSVDQKLADAASKDELELLIRLQVGGGGGDADVYVAAHPVIFPSRDEHQWSSHDTGTKVISLAGASVGVYSIAVFGFRGVSSFTLAVEGRESREKPAAGHRVGGAEAKMVQDGYETCGNCKQMIPSRTLPLHEAYCIRHNVPCGYPGCGIVLRREEAGQHVHCPGCGEAFRQEELQKHLEVFHVAHSCDCGVVLEMQAMVKHKATDCPLRKITCRFCGDVVQAGGDAKDLRDRLNGLSQHESSCGSRTDECDVCHRAVMLKAMDLHRAAVHGGAGSLSSGPREEEEEEEEESTSEQCPICDKIFDGVTAINRHFESDHFGPSSIPAKSSPPPPSIPSSFRQSLSVLCPICGMAVHSERDLSSHIDMVH
ncbi:uncharacterized protein LOC112341687 [Selaginella moellendorffii]|uniref:uncharacterized protein LOC112341687 n=1 Tax=Selaginella moellendorffii TaxID=88036 RepID=UPI000D1CA13A|nr:uncharacterized protein LOC112341687 [Selaginella moellendorffii]|eukprot:XP_024518034.1 uncharacterized protein LOC112341687 [Selaginella moellendorffii]